MKLLKTTFLAALFSVSALTAAPSTQFKDYDFQQERMILTPDSVIAISSFDEKDYITAYSFNGNNLWNTSFHAKILSWQVVSDYIFVFSKHRDGNKTYITCLDRFDGHLIWQRP